MIHDQQVLDEKNYILHEYKFQDQKKMIPI